jgi:hypothetical protein
LAASVSREKQRVSNHCPTVRAPPALGSQVTSGRLVSDVSATSTGSVTVSAKPLCAWTIALRDQPPSAYCSHAPRSSKVGST